MSLRKSTYACQEVFLPLGLGETIRKVRKQLDWTQDRLAEALGVKEPSIRNYEHGRHKVNPFVLRRLADLAPPELVGLINEHLPVELRKIADPLSVVPSDIREEIEATAGRSKKTLDEYLAEMIILGWQAHPEGLRASTRKSRRSSNSLTPEEVEQRVRAFAENQRRALANNRPGDTIEAAAPRDSKDRKAKTA